MTLMEFLNQISLVSFIVLLLSSSTTILNPVNAAESCNFPAIFNLGASNSDTGGLGAAFGELKSPKSPNGETYFHRPSGRFSDGRIILDFIAESFGLPHVHSYLNSLGANYSQGANFATYSSTIRIPESIVPNGKFSPFSLGVQVAQLKDFIPNTKFIRSQGGIFATLMPKEEYFSKALYTFDIGQNDLTAGFVSKGLPHLVRASVPDIVNTFSAHIKDIYNLGARSFWIHNTGPIGCFPFILTTFKVTLKDRYGCSKPHNEVAQYFNQKLKEAVVQLRQELPQAAITYVDVYSIKYSFVSDPKKYGFEQPLVACCGNGGFYNFNNKVSCGGTMDNGNHVGACEKPSTRPIWDGIHYTEAANKIVFDQISSGAFTDPPIPLNMSCQRTNSSIRENLHHVKLNKQGFGLYHVT
ncbi:GDSL esterase/lipase ENOD8-like [Lotus japonicus]|uniref:GDSL esterase/lipase ENOD8-like n=1 Tax=Lotus japonicus TaxID=34305 RepID=UPI002582BA16|nr:GDSL esterase/lipase ENOD8-like [Lotus japonicus]